MLLFLFKPAFCLRLPTFFFSTFHFETVIERKVFIVYVLKLWGSVNQIGILCVGKICDQNKCQWVWSGGKWSVIRRRLSYLVVRCFVSVPLPIGLNFILCMFSWDILQFAQFQKLFSVNHKAMLDFFFFEATTEVSYNHWFLIPNSCS